MIIRSVSIQGLAGLSSDPLDPLGRVVRVGGSPRCTRSLIDGLLLGFGALEPLVAAGALGWLGVSAQEDQGSWVIGSPARLRGLLTPGPTSTVSVRLELELDPPQFGALREQAITDPDLVDALGEATLRLNTGWAFTTDNEVGTPSVLSAQLGGHRLDLQTRKWVLPWLQGLGTRLNVHTPGRPDPVRWARCGRSADPERRSAFHRAVRVLGRAPFELPALHVVEEAGAPWLALGEELLPLERFGPRAQNAVALVEAVFLDDAEILVVEEPGALSLRPRAVVNWLARQAEEEGSPLEQVFLVGPGGGLTLRSPQALQGRALTL